MKYRITIDIFIDPKHRHIIAAVIKFMKFLTKYCETINRGKINEVRSRIVIHECYHDESPPKPCRIIYEWSSE